MTAGQRLPLLRRPASSGNRRESGRTIRRPPAIGSMGKGIEVTRTGTIIGTMMAIASAHAKQRLKERLIRPRKPRVLSRSPAAAINSTSRSSRAAVSARMIAAVTRGLLVRRASSQSLQAPRRSVHPVV